MRAALAASIVLMLAGCAFRPSNEIAAFTSDGCSAFPDSSSSADWCDCCYEHDLVYWSGGTAQERDEADQKLRECVNARTGGTALGQTMYVGVRFGGHPALPMPWRWGYGWPWGRWYEPVDAEEARKIEGLREQVRGDYQRQVCPVHR